MIKKTEKYNVVVCGGGMAGFCAAVAAARHGAKTCLIQDRPVFGGNASSEIRVNKNAANVVSQPVATPNGDKWQLSGDSYAGSFNQMEFFEFICRYTADNTALQDQFIDYMAYQVGLTG